MKILMINKFLYPNGGSETYMFGLGQQLEKMGHEVQYFGPLCGQPGGGLHQQHGFPRRKQAGEAYISAQDHLFLRGPAEAAAGAG